MRKTSDTMIDLIPIFVLVVMAVTADAVLGLPVAQTNGIEMLDANDDIETLTLSDDDRFLQLYSEMTTVLHRLNIVSHPSNSSICMGLERIQRKVKLSDTSDSLKEIMVVLYFKEATFLDIPDRTGGTTGLANPVCKYGSFRRIPSGLSSDSLKEDSGNSSQPKKHTNVTLAHGETDQKTKGLSQTQVAVIVTCAVVLGAFFIIAGILRIRSCLQRYRTSRELALSITGRSSNIGINGSNFSAGNLRRESSTSKASRQSNPSTKGGSDLQINRTSRIPPNIAPTTPPLHSSDHKPLLPGQRSCSDGSETESSHGPSAYMDDASHRKIKGDKHEETESELESEDDPLLRKSPDSGSSIDITMADVYNVENKSVGSFKQTSEQQSGKDSDVNYNDMSTNSQSDNNMSKKSYDSIIIDDESSLNNNGFTEIYPESDRDKRSVLQRQSYSIDSFAFDVNEWTFGSGLFNRSNEFSEPAQNIAETYAVTIGLNQSDSSISNNPSYCYGNQTEYVCNGGYGNVGYRSPNDAIYYDKYRYSDSGDCDGTRTTVNHNASFDIDNGLSRDAAVNKNNSISPSDISTGSLSISKDSSGEPLLSQNHQHSRTPSNGTSPGTGADNLALADSGEDEPRTGSSPCTVVSVIVPLAVYHRNSMC